MVKATGLIIGFVLSGALIVYSTYKSNKVSIFQNVQITPQICPNGKSDDKRFTHPFIQTMLMFAGESLCLAYLYFDKRKNGKKYRSKQDMAKFGGRYRSKVYFFALSSFLDLMSTAIYFFALDIIGGSTYTIFRAGRILVVALCMKCFTNITYQKHHVTGTFITVVGLCLVDAADIFGSSSGTFSIGGFSLIVVSMIFSGLCITYQQRLFLYYYTEPLRLVGFEGLFGMGYCIILILIFNFTHCPFSDNQCVCANGDSYIEHIPTYFDQIKNQEILILFEVLLMVSCSIFNLCGAIVVNLINGLARSVMEPLRMILVWIVGLILTLAIGNRSIYGNQIVISPLVISLKVVGFIILIIGVLLYFDLIRVKGLSKTREVTEKYSLMIDQD